MEQIFGGGILWTLLIGFLAEPALLIGPVQFGRIDMIFGFVRRRALGQHFCHAIEQFLQWRTRCDNSIPWLGIATRWRILGLSKDMFQNRFVYRLIQIFPY